MLAVKPVLTLVITYLPIPVRPDPLVRCNSSWLLVYCPLFHQHGVSTYKGQWPTCFTFCFLNFINRCMHLKCVFFLFITLQWFPLLVQNFKSLQPCPPDLADDSLLKFMLCSTLSHYFTEMIDRQEMHMLKACKFLLLGRILRRKMVGQVIGSMLDILSCPSVFQSGYNIL